MKVREITGSHLRQISSSAMLSEAVDRMRALGVCALPVVEYNQVVGVVTERDVVARAACEGINLRTTPVQYVMTTEVACCSDEDDVENAVRAMEDRHAHWLVVLSPDQKAVDLLSLTDLTSKMGQEHRASEAQETICDPVPGT